MDPHEKIETESSDGSKTDESDEVEPVLSYERMKGDVTTILSDDFASCMRVNSRILILGTHWGKVHVLDHLGNRIKTYDNHNGTVNEVTIDSSEEFVASCGDDGKVVIFSLCDQTFSQTTTFDRPIKCIALEPNFIKTKSYVTGDTTLILNEKGFLGRNKTTLLHEGEGLIRTIRWNGSFIAWSNSRGVKIYSINEKRIITYITKDHDVNLRDELYRCSLLWTDPYTLVICWADRLKICKIKLKKSAQLTQTPLASSRSSAIISFASNAATSGAVLASSLVGNEKKDSMTYVEITNMIETNFYISGVAVYENELLILSYFKESDDEETEDRRPLVRILKAYPDYYEECSVDLIDVRNSDKNKCCDYRLDFIQEENMYFIVSPKDIVVAKPRNMDDHIKWLIDHQKFEEALDKTKENENELKKHSYLSVGTNFIDFLLYTKQFDEASGWCSRILNESKITDEKILEKIWEEKIIIFAKESQLEAIADIIPSSNPILAPAVYEKILSELLTNKNYKLFKYLIKKWPCNIYDIVCITTVALDYHSKDENKVLLESIAILYEYQKFFDRSFVIYISLQDQAVFDLVKTHNLFDCAFQNIIPLIKLNRQKALKILLDNIETIPIKKVVEELNKNKLYLHYYLDAVFQKDPNISKDYHTDQVALYAEFEREKLLKFLQQSQYIVLARAQQECQQRQLIPEVVYILERMGQIKQALQLIIYGIKDVTQAIEFCKRHNDKDLWDDLIKFSINKPDFIIGLLNNVGTYVDPKELIDKIPNGLKIKGLREALVKILNDYRVQISLLEGSKKIMTKDCLSLMEKQIKLVKKGISVDEKHLCEICKTHLISNIQSRKLIIFECKHSYHDDCLPKEPADMCTICNQAQKTSSKLKF